MPDVTALPRPGDVFAGKYLIERVIGSGKNSLVFVAQHCVTGKRFAIEWLVPRAEHARHDALIDVDDPENTPAAVSGKHTEVSEVRDAADLVSEADDLDASEHHVVGHFRHPNVLEVYDVGEASGSLYTVMEWSDGESLEARLARTGPMSIVEASALLVPCMRGMHEAHASGILHRDLKPSNIFLCQPTQSGPLVAKVLDFEVASDIGGSADASAIVSWRGTRESKPYYRAPEQIGGLEVDHRADVYAFGAILYEMLTGRPPFAPVRYARRDERATHGVPALQSRSERLPPGADAIIGRAMARDVSRRFQTLHELADAFEALSRSLLASPGSTLAGSPPFDGEAVRAATAIVPPPFVLGGHGEGASEGYDAGTDPGSFNHEVSFTRSRPWPRPMRSEASDGSIAPESAWRAALDWDDPNRTSHVPEWSEPPNALEWTEEEEAPYATHTHFFVETSFGPRPSGRRTRRRYKTGYIAGVVAVLVVAGFVAYDKANGTEPEPDSVARYAAEPGTSESANEFEAWPAAPPPARAPVAAAQGVVEPPVERARNPVPESIARQAESPDSPARLPFGASTPDWPAEPERAPRAKPAPAPKAPTTAPARPRPKPAARPANVYERKAPSIPAASDDPLPMQLM